MSDAQLIARLQACEETAYNEIITRYGDSLYAYIYRYTGDHDLAQDVLSETYLSMVEAISRYTERGYRFKAWLYRIAHNRALNALRWQRCYRPLNEDFPCTNDAFEEIIEQLDLQDKKRVLRAGLATLSLAQQQVLYQRFIAEQPTAQIACDLGKSEIAIRQLQWRGLRRLERLLIQADHAQSQYSVI